MAKRKTSMNGFADPSLTVRHVPASSLDLSVLEGRSRWG